MPKTFLHYLDGEFSKIVGATVARRYADAELKRLALFGAELCIGDVMLMDSGVLQHAYLSGDFRHLVKKLDPGLLAVDVGSDGSKRSRRELAYHGARRMQPDEWVSSSATGTAAMKAFARAAPKSSSFDEVLAQMRQDPTLELSERSRRRLEGVYDIVEWFANDKKKAQLRPKDLQPGTANSYWDVLQEAVGRCRDDREARLLADVVEYVDGVRQRVDPDRRHMRSCVIDALRVDRRTRRSFKRDVRATVALAWSTSVARGSSATMSTMAPLGAGVAVPSLLDEPMELQVINPNRRRFTDRLGGEAHLTQLKVPSQVTWSVVAAVVEETAETRTALRAATPGKRYDRAYDAHVEALDRELSNRAVARTDVLWRAGLVGTGAVVGHRLGLGPAVEGALGYVLDRKLGDLPQQAAAATLSVWVRKAALRDGAPTR